jgi:hypothetical protein
MGANKTPPNEVEFWSIIAIWVYGVFYVPIKGHIEYRTLIGCLANTF